MPDSINKYLDPAALDETVLNIRQLTEALEEEMQNLPYARPDGLYPDMTVGAVIGADETAQWAQRESTGSGTAIVRSVQGATEVQNGELVPVRIAGIESATAQSIVLDSIEWPTFTLRAAGSVVDELTSDALITRVGVVDLGTLTNWLKNQYGIFFTRVPNMLVPATSTLRNDGIQCAAYLVDTDTTAINENMADKTMKRNAGYIYIKDTSYDDIATFVTAMNGVLLYYELATPTTTPISPALPMTYRVEQGGSEAIIVPSGEVSAVPVLTVAEPVNAGDEFARLWAAIESLGYTRNTAQLSRPVSLTDIGSIDEVQKDTTEIDTTKEVTE